MNYRPLAEVRKSLRVKWYRSPIEFATLRELSKRSDAQGWFQAGGHLVLWACTGALVVFAVLQYLLFWTPIGNWLLATGGSAESAHSRGVNVMRTKWGAFIVCALLAGLAGILEAGDLSYADGTLGRQRELQAIAAVVLGGTARSEDALRW